MSANPIPTDDHLDALARAVGDAAMARPLRVATAESCTGGWIAKTLTDIPGSSAWFEGGLVTYSNTLKHALLGVTTATLDQHGAVSRECALEMVAGALDHLGVDIAVAVTGIAGPDGGTADKPVGSVWIGWKQRGADARATLYHFAGDREAVRRRTVAAALHGLAGILTGKP